MWRNFKMQKLESLFAAGRNLLILAGSVCLIGGAAQAQDSGAAKDQGYKVGENKQANVVDDQLPLPQADKAASTGQRFMRFDYVSGNVTWRAAENGAWSKATVNVSLHEGSQIWAADGGRAEIRFNDGSLLRLGNNAVITLQTVFSDAQGEFTQIKMVSGLATMRLRREHSLYQVDAGGVSVKATGPAEVRIGMTKETEVGVRMGQATIEGKPGKTVLHAGNYVAVGSTDAPYSFTKLPAEDSWDRWNDERDRKIDPQSYPYPRAYPAYGPAPAFFFGLNVPIGPVYHPYFGRGLWHRW